VSVLMPITRAKSPDDDNRGLPSTPGSRHRLQALPPALFERPRKPQARLRLRRLGRSRQPWFTSCMATLWQPAWVATICCWDAAGKPQSE
jgi:hypothetical protein